MINDLRVLAIIPARGGSKRLPGKNTKNLNGKPLIAWTIISALKSKYIDRLIVSTDNAEIATVSEEYGAEVPFIRPSSLSSDIASTRDVVLHAVSELSDEFDLIVVLQPTSPLRITSDIDNSLELLESRSGDGVVSVCECEHSPLWSNRLPENKSMKGFLSSEIQGLRSQDIPKYFRLNGAVYVYSTAKYLRSDFDLNTSNAYAFEMSIERSVDIDTKVDFMLANALMGERDIDFY